MKITDFNNFCDNAKNNYNEACHMCWAFLNMTDRQVVKFIDKVSVPNDDVYLVDYPNGEVRVTFNHMLLSLPQDVYIEKGGAYIDTFMHTSMLL